jgi:hypothetical protein
MNKANRSNFFKNPEIAEHTSEMFYLLNFFSKTQLQQWAAVPDDFPPAWVELGGIQCNADRSILFLTLILSGRIYMNFVEPYRYIFNEEKMISILCEIYALLTDWILNHPDYDFIFSKRPDDEIMNPDRIWLILSRLCKIALSFENWDEYHINELSFEYFQEKYTHTYDPL